jgi:hypothetical protein
VVPVIKDANSVPYVNVSIGAMEMTAVCFDTTRGVVLVAVDDE